MIRFLKAAIRGVRAEVTYGGAGGWQAFSGSAPFSDFGKRSNSGMIVSSESVLQLSAVWACVSRTSQLVATLPLKLMERTGDGHAIAIRNPLSEIVTRRPNMVQTNVEFWEGMVAHALLRGNGYAEKLRVADRVVALRPLLNCTPKRRKDGRFDYRVVEIGGTRELGPDDVWHLRGFGGGDGLGMSAIKYGVQSFGAALASDNTAASVFSNAMMNAGFLKTEGTLTSEQRDQVKEMLERFTGSSKAGKTAVLEAGFDWQQVQISPEDAQLLETRRFQVEDICRWFGMPPIIIGHAAEGQTMWGTGVESIMLSWLTTGINPLLRRIEARMNADLIPSAKRERWFFEFNREAMLQMDSNAKAEFLSRMATSGTMTANERREKLGLARHEDPVADDLLAQTALAPLEFLRGQE